MDTYKINLAGSDDENAFYEKEDKNFIQVQVDLPSGKTFDSESAVVYINLSKEAMIALGTELIRAAFLSKEEMWELFPADSKSASKVLGIYMHPRSCLLKINKEDMGPLAEIIEMESV